VNHWLFEIPAIRRPEWNDLWDICRRKLVCAGGFPPKSHYKVNHPKAWKAFENCARQIRKGDGVIAYLLARRIGAVGLVRESYYRYTDTDWNPLLGTTPGGDFGRLLRMKWIIRPPNGSVIRIPPGRLVRVYRPTLNRITKAEFDRYTAIARDSRNYEHQRDFFRKHGHP